MEEEEPGDSGGLSSPLGVVFCRHAPVEPVVMAILLPHVRRTTAFQGVLSKEMVERIWRNKNKHET